MTAEPDPALLDRYLNAAPDAVLVVRQDGRITLVNDRAVELFGYSRPDLLRCQIEDLVPDAVRGAHVSHRSGYQAAPRARAMGDPGARLQAQTASGSLVPVEIALSPVPDDNAVIAIIRDVTERVAAEVEHEGVRRSLDAVGDAVFMFDPATLEFTYANAGASAQTGYSRPELLAAMTPLHIAREFDDRSFQRLVRPLINGSLSSVTYETTHRTKQGEDLPVEVVLSWPETAAELARPLVAIVRDIRERRAAEQRIRRSEAAFRSAFDDAAVPMAILHLSDAGLRPIERANDALGRLLGYSTGDLIGLDEAELTHPDDRAAAVDRDAELVADQTTYQMEKRYRCADGSHRWVVVNASVLQAGPDGPRALVHVTDVTRRIQAERDRDRREDLLITLASVRKATLDEAPVNEVLQLVVSGAIEALGGLTAALLTTGRGDRLEVRAQSGPPELSGFAQAVADEPIAKQVLRAAEVRKLSAAESEHLGPGPVVLAAMRTSDSVEGLLAVAGGPDHPVFGPDDLDVAQSLAAEAALSLALAQARDVRRRMLVVEDRERIARDLHDVVIQRLFASGMRLQAATNRPEMLQERAAEVIRDLDETIADIRNSIFDLTQPDQSVRGELERVVERHRAVGRNEIGLVIDKSAEHISSDVVDQMLPAISELLSNVERHANASRAEVRLTVLDGRLVVTVTDDGIGVDDGPSPGFGLRNLRRRAGSLGGEFEYGPGPGGRGTQSVWSVPTSEPEPRNQSGTTTTGQ